MKKTNYLKKINNLSFENLKVFIIEHCIVYMKKYPMLLYFVVTCLFNTLLLRILSVGNLFYFKPLLADLGMIFIFSSFMFLFKNDKRRKKYLVILSFITSIICCIHSVYYTYYDSFASISLLATSAFVVEVGDAVVEQVLNFSDLLYLWQPIFMIVYYFREKNKISSNKKNSLIKNKNQMFIDFLCCGFVILATTSVFMTKLEWGRFSKMWNRESVVASFGIFIYQVNDIFQSLEPKINNLFGHDEALKKVIKYYENVDNTVLSNEYSGLFEGMNLIVIHAESLQTIALESEFNGISVAPTIKRLANEGIYFSNYYSPVGVGTSSDAEFMFSSSLMPSSNGTVFVNYFDREYNTIQKSFKEKGYYTFSMHGNTADFWNRSAMHKNMGYDDFYSKTSFEINETIGLGISDKSFFRQAIPIIEGINNDNKLFYGNLITLTNHTPWGDLDLLEQYDMSLTVEIEGEEVTRDYLNDTVLGNYFRSVHYMDQAIEQFLRDLDESGILENTVLVIYGDHDARINKNNYDYMYNYNPYTDSVREEGDDGYVDYNEYEYKIDKNVPFIIWTKNKNINEIVDTPTSMIDAFPILSNLFGLEFNEFGLGKDILGNKYDDNTIVFTDGSYLTKKIYYNGQNGEIYPINGGVVDEDYIRANSLYADTLIDISNDIITYNLIKEINDKRLNNEN